MFVFLKAMPTEKDWLYYYLWVWTLLFLWASPEGRGHVPGSKLFSLWLGQMQPGPERAELPVVTKMQVLGKPLTSEMIPRAVVLRNISSNFGSDLPVLWPSMNHFSKFSHQQNGGD